MIYEGSRIIDSITRRSFAFCLSWYRYNYDSFPYAYENGKVPYWLYLKPFRCSTKSSIEQCLSLYHYCVHSNILQNVSICLSISILF